MVKPQQWRVWLALAAVYLVWGSTYLGQRIGLEGFPPFILNGLRFIIAGAVLYGFLRWRGIAPPTPVQWWSLAQIAGLMLVGGVGLVTMAEHEGVGSGVAAAAVAVMPLWAAIWSGLFGEWPRRLEWAGLVVGFAGVVLLTREGDLQSSPLGLVFIVAAPMSWALGSVWSRRLDLPTPTMATAAELLSGGVILLILGPAIGERVTTNPELGAWLALAYLTVMGSIVAFTAYVYLLRTVSGPLATSYAYVNPVVAVALGMALGGETVSGPVYIALPLILAGVGVVAVANRRPRHVESVERVEPLPKLAPAREAA